MARLPALEPLKQTFHDIFLTDCQTVDGSVTASVEPRLHLDYSLLYVLEGQGSLTINHQSYPLQAGQGMLICPNDLCHSIADSARPWRYLLVSFNGARAVTYLSFCKLSAGQRDFLSTHNKQLAELVHQMHYLYASSSAALRLQGLLFEFLAYLAEDAQLPFTFQQLKNPYVLQTVRYIQDHYAENLQISTLAQRFNVNRCYLAALFKRELGLSPHSFLMQYRMQCAEALLRNTHLPIAEIGGYCGYSDPDSFGKAFKKITGRQPSSYRKKDQ